MIAAGCDAESRKGWFVPVGRQAEFLEEGGVFGIGGEVVELVGVFPEGEFNEGEFVVFSLESLSPLEAISGIRRGVVKNM